MRTLTCLFCHKWAVVSPMLEKITSRTGSWVFSCRVVALACVTHLVFATVLCSQKANLKYEHSSLEKLNVIKTKTVVGFLVSKKEICLSEDKSIK